MSTTQPLNWMHLSSCPLSDVGNVHSAMYRNMIVPYGIDDNNYIVIARCNSIYEFEKNYIICIYKYNIDTDQWIKMNDYNQVLNTSAYSAALNVNKQILFILVSKTLTEIKLDTCEINIHTINDAINQVNSTIFFGNNSLFLGDICSKSILKWNPITKTFTKFNDMYNNTNISHFGAIKNSKNDCFLLFGGVFWPNRTTSTDILELNVKTKQWNKLPISLPNQINEICCAIAINNRYVFLFGGYMYWRPCNYIYIYCLKDKTITPSKIKCPISGIFSAITVNNKIKDEKLVWGYVRKQWVNCKIDDHQFPPTYLMKLMHSYYLNEFIYLLDKLSKKHYKINSLDI
eukprot:155942_1